MTRWGKSAMIFRCGRKIVHNRFPHDIYFYIDVVMNKNIPHTGHILPGNIRVLVLNIV